jgi:hypothetical protein
MTFTELEIVLGIAFVAILYINHRLLRVVERRQYTINRMMDTLAGVVDKRLTLRRTEQGIEVIKLEKHDGNQAGQSASTNHS